MSHMCIFILLLSDKIFQNINNLLIYIKLSIILSKRLVYENNTDNQTIEYVYRTLIYLYMFS